MKIKVGVILLLSIVFISVFFIDVGATENINLNSSDDSYTEEEQEAIEEVLKENEKELEELYKYIDSLKLDVELMNELDPVEYIQSYIKNGKGNISVNTALKAVVSLVFKEVDSVLALSLSILAIAIISTLIKNLQNAFNSEGVSEVAFYACYVILVMVLSKSFLISIQVAKDVIYSISDFMGAVLPILVSMIALSGGVVEATTLDPIVMSAVLLIPRVYTYIIIPLILIGFVLQFANNLSNEHKIDNLCKLVKQVTMWLQGIIITAFIALLTIRGMSSSTIDAVTLKTTKFAIDNFVPIVGKAFSDAITSVAAYSLIIKNAVSAVGLVVIVLIILYPIIKIVLMTFIYKISASLIEPISDKRITSCIQAAGESLTVLLSCVLSVSLMFFVLIAIMASASKFIVGA